MKIIGGIFILCAGVLISYFYEKEQRLKIVYLSKIADFIHFARSQIEFFSLPYNKIIESYTENEDTRSLIRNGFKEYLDILSLEDKKNIKAFFSSIGKGFATEELSLCDYTVSYIEKSNDKNKAECPNKIKIFRSMALFVAISIIILLV